MHLTREDLHAFVYGARGWGRYTQDSPIMPDVWFGFGADPSAPLDLLVEPFRGVPPGRLADELRPRLQRALGKGAAQAGTGLAYDETYVVVRLTLEQAIVVLLPLTQWWKDYTGPLAGLSATAIARALERDERERQKEGAAGARDAKTLTGHGTWFLRLAGSLLAAAARPGDEALRDTPKAAEMGAALAPVLARAEQAADEKPLLWSVNRNREAYVAVWDSRRAVKADASEQIFRLDCKDLAWAILDTGIDARHTAFRMRDEKGQPVKAKKEFSEQTRVRATYDFTRIRSLVEDDPEGVLAGVGGATELRRRLVAGRAIDWELLEPKLRVPHDAHYVVPEHSHGTHVAGILASDWRMSDPGFDADDENDVRGMCPTIRLYDLRVLDENGLGDEFSVMAALQFVRYLNARSHHLLIHGVNLSLSIPHDVSNYACGRTPVCDEAERLHSSGVIVVAAAGNEGYVHYLTRAGESSAYRNISITDPGNAECILTVGATHGRRPHAYGVSYFSSRGPTGDGRLKPDLVAPGEKIKSPAPGESYERADGTSMAAPHVSGAAALLLARHSEFIGDPTRVKQILCSTATDLGRERHFQGAGLVDVLRAIQSV